MKNTSIASVLAALLPLFPLSLLATNHYSPGTTGNDSPMPYHQFVSEHHAQRQPPQSRNEPDNKKDGAIEHNEGDDNNTASPTANSVVALLCGRSIAPLERTNHPFAPESTHSASAWQILIKSTGAEPPATTPRTPTSESTDYQPRFIIRKF